MINDTDDMRYYARPSYGILNTVDFSTVEEAIQWLIDTDQEGAVGEYDEHGEIAYRYKSGRIVIYRDF